MGTKSKDGIRTMVAKDLLEIYNHSIETQQSITDSFENLKEYLHSLIAQIPHATPGPLIPKTPKTVKKRGGQRIETIPEDGVVEISTVDSVIIKTELNDTEVIRPSGRVKRQASKKAETNIKIQQNQTLQTKLRRPSGIEDEIETKPKKRESRAKRKKTSRGSSDEDEARGPLKHSRREDTMTMTTADSSKHPASNETIILEPKRDSPRRTRTSSKKRSSGIQEEPTNKHFMGDDTLIAPVRDDIEEPSMYEDAMCKPVPIMNSTMNINAPAMQKLMNATVVLDQLPLSNLNTTVTIAKKDLLATKGQPQEPDENKGMQNDGKKPTRKLRTSSSSTGSTLQDRKQDIKVPIASNIDDLLTDDESSPEIKKVRNTFKKPEEKKKRGKPKRIDSLSDDDNYSPPRKIGRGAKKDSTVQDGKVGYKSSALFSPYAKESVKKRVEAFEQARINSPKTAVDVNAPTRVTRTKTRALAAAEAEAEKNPEDKEKIIAQQLARKSLAKAKRISLAKGFKETDDYKENLLQSAHKPSRLVNDKASSKQHQKTTPLGKTKTLLPMSVNRIQHTPSNQHIPSSQTKALSATRSNILTNMDSFLISKASKTNSTEKLEDKKRKMNDEDARKKREDAIRMQTEEKKRKREEKELKNKLAREAKEKMEMEKRLKAEREREEKARMAQQQIEKLREEAEKKRQLQIQRLQEKEERRRLEEQQRLLRLREQEEAERVLAEQRRREQEAERRKDAEARTQQQAAAEVMRLKQQILTAQAKHQHANNKKHEGPVNYILDSEPDDDQSDNESEPKHAIPYWSQSHVRKAHLEMQRYIPTYAICKFFDAKKSTPDLTEFFHGIDRSRLKRTSSAIWKTPPRYSMME